MISPMLPSAGSPVPVTPPVEFPEPDVAPAPAEVAGPFVDADVPALPVLSRRVFVAPAPPVPAAEDATVESEDTAASAPVTCSNNGSR